MCVMAEWVLTVELQLGYMEEYLWPLLHYLVELTLNCHILEGTEAL